MFSRLIASRATRQRHGAAVMFSMLVHAGLFAAIVYGTHAVGVGLIGKRVAENVTYVALPLLTTPEAARQTAPRSRTPAAPERPPAIPAPPTIPSFQLHIARIATPDVVPNIDLSPGPAAAASVVGARAADTAGRVTEPLTTTAAGVLLGAAPTERQASLIGPLQPPAYPSALRFAGVEGRVVASFVVDTTGRVELQSFRAISSTDTLFTKAVKKVVASYRFAPAEIGARKVPERVVVPFDFHFEGH